MTADDDDEDVIHQAGTTSADDIGGTDTDSFHIKKSTKSHKNDHSINKKSHRGGKKSHSAHKKEKHA